MTNFIFCHISVMLGGFGRGFIKSFANRE